MKIRQMIFLILIVSSILPLLIISTWGVKAYSDRIEQLVEDNLKSAATAQVQSIERFFLQADHSLTMLGNFQTVWALLRASNRDDMEEVRRLRPFIDDVLTTQKREYFYIESVTLFDRNFRIVASSFPVETGRVSKLKGMEEKFVRDQTFITNLVPAAISSGNKEVIAGIRPIYCDNVLSGYIVDEMNLSYFEDLRESMYMIETGTLHLIDAKQNLVMAGNREMTKADYQRQQVDIVDFSRQWKASSGAEKERGLLTYVSDGVQYLTYYAVIENTGWRVFVSANLDVLTKKENGFRNMAISFCGMFICLLLWGNYMASRRVAHPVEDLITQVMQIRDNKSFGLRIRRMPDNEIGKIAGVFNALLDHIAQNTKELQQSREKYNIVIAQTNHVFIERDYGKGTWFVSHKFEEIIGYPFPFCKLKQMEEMTEYIHVDDRRNYRKWIMKSYQATDNMQIELRIKQRDTSFRWIHFTLLPIVDQAGKVTNSIGLMTDIDKEKREVERLQNKAQLDPLTQLLNKSALQSSICAIIEQKQTCAVLFIDIDDFKKFNTNYGHLCGDEVLIFVARMLQKHMRGFVGRSGGDEFIVCALGFSSIVELEPELAILLQVFADGLTIQASQEKVRIGCSIGIAFYPQSGGSYEELLRKADAAMYEVKKSGKNNYFVIS